MSVDKGINIGVIKTYAGLIKTVVAFGLSFGVSLSVIVIAYSNKKINEGSENTKEKFIAFSDSVRTDAKQDYEKYSVDITNKMLAQNKRSLDSLSVTVGLSIDYALIGGMLKKEMAPLANEARKLNSNFTLYKEELHTMRIDTIFDQTATYIGPNGIIIKVKTRYNPLTDEIEIIDITQKP